MRITVVTDRLQKPACFVDTPDAALTFPWCWQPDDGYRIAGDDLFLDRAGESSTERGASVLAALRRQSLMAAFTDRATPSLGYRPGSVLPLRAVLADTRELIDPLPDVLDLELVDSLLPQMRNDVQTNEQLIRLVCLGCQVRLDDVFKPVREEVAKLGCVGADRSDLAVHHPDLDSDSPQVRRPCRCLASLDH